jgi:hypothetical protein
MDLSQIDQKLEVGNFSSVHGFPERYKHIRFFFVSRIIFRPKPEVCENGNIGGYCQKPICLIYHQSPPTPHRRQTNPSHSFLFIFLGANEAASTVVKTNIGDALVFIDRYYGYLGFTLLTSFFY